jgi:hypothetical protein
VAFGQAAKPRLGEHALRIIEFTRSNPVNLQWGLRCRRRELTLIRSKSCATQLMSNQFRITGCSTPSPPRPGSIGSTSLDTHETPRV